MRFRRRPEVIAGRVNSDGTIGAGDGFTVSRVTTGQYALVFPAGFRILSLTGAIYGTAGVVSFVVVAGTLVGNTAQFYTLNTASAQADAATTFTAVGIQQ